MGERCAAPRLANPLVRSRRARPPRPTAAPDRCHDTTSWAERCCPRGRGSRAGKQTRSFCYIDDAVEGILRLMVSDYKKPLNIGSDEMVSMNQMADIVLEASGKKGMPIKHIPGPEGVRGRNSDNTLIKEVLGWAPSISLKEGLGYTHAWIQSQIELWVKEGNTLASLTQSKVCSQQMTDKCDQAHKDETQ